MRQRPSLDIDLLELMCVGVIGDVDAGAAVAIARIGIPDAEAERLDSVCEDIGYGSVPDEFSGSRVVGEQVVYKRGAELFGFFHRWTI